MEASPAFQNSDPKMDLDTIAVITAPPVSESEDDGVAKPFIAIADDNTVDRALTARLCMRLGCAVVCFTDALHMTADFSTFTALGGSSANYADIIICDYDMPGMRGDRAARKLRKDGFQNPIVVVTSTIGVEADCMEAGATRVFLKPITNAIIKALLIIDEGKRILLIRKLMPRCLTNATTRGASQHNFILMPPASSTEKRRHAKEVKDLKKSASDSVELFQHEVSDLILQLAVTQEHLHVEKESHAVLRVEHAELLAAFKRLQRWEALTTDGSPITSILSPADASGGDTTTSPNPPAGDSTTFQHVVHD